MPELLGIYLIVIIITIPRIQCLSSFISFQIDIQWCLDTIWKVGVLKIAGNVNPYDSWRAFLCEWRRICLGGKCNHSVGTSNRSGRTSAIICMFSLCTMRKETNIKGSCFCWCTQWNIWVSIIGWLTHDRKNMVHGYVCVCVCRQSVIFILTFLCSPKFKSSSSRN